MELNSCLRLEQCLLSDHQLEGKPHQAGRLKVAHSSYKHFSSKFCPSPPPSGPASSLSPPFLSITLSGGPPQWSLLCFPISSRQGYAFVPLSHLAQECYRCGGLICFITSFTSPRPSVYRFLTKVNSSSASQELAPYLCSGDAFYSTTPWGKTGHILVVLEIQFNLQ